MNRKTALVIIQKDYLENGKDTGKATRAKIEGGVSMKFYLEYAKKGLKKYDLTFGKKEL